MTGKPLIKSGDAGLIARAYNLGMKFVPNIAHVITREDLEYWERDLLDIKFVVAHGFKHRITEANAVIPDTIIRITRPVRPTYPVWVKKVMHEDLHDVGPGEYDLASIDLWLHDGQRNGGSTTGNVIYEDFKRNDSLKTCLGLRDGEEIQKKGIAVFRQFFGGKVVFLWKSVVLRSNGDLLVPYLYGCGGKVVVDWDWLGGDWYGRNPAARFAS